mgnify:CR=1 FL=1
MKHLALLLVAFSSLTQAGIHKWVDDDGQVHYGDIPPTVEAQTFNHSGAPTSGNAQTAMLAQAEDGLDCQTALDRANAQIDESLAFTQQQFDSGQIPERQYEITKEVTEEARAGLSESECRGSSGTTRQFYRCLQDQATRYGNCMMDYPR